MGKSRFEQGEFDDGVRRSPLLSFIRGRHNNIKAPDVIAVQAGYPAGILTASESFPGRRREFSDMPNPAIVVHYHELWLKGGNRRFFLSKLHMALKRALEGLPVERILRPGDRMLIEFAEGASMEEAVTRIERVFGVAFYAIARR